MATTPDTRSTSSPGESRTQHFASGVFKATGVHNGMNDHRGIPRFGAGDYSDIDDGMAGIDYHDSFGRRSPGDSDD